MSDKYTEQVVKSIRAIANMIEASPGCFAGFGSRHNVVEKSEVVRVLVQEFTVRLDHVICQWDLPGTDGEET